MAREIKVERCYFALSVELVLGLDCDFEIENTADLEFQPDRIMTTAPCPGFVTLASATLDGADVLGYGLDAFTFSCFNPSNAGPSISPDHRRFAGPSKPTRVVGRYTGLVPPDAIQGVKLPFIVRFSGFTPDTLKAIGSAG